MTLPMLHHTAAATKPKLFCLAAVITFSHLLSPSQAASPDLRPMDGAFMQIMDMRQLSVAQWRAEMEAMRKAKMRILIIQWTELDGRPLFDDPDPFPGFLDEARRCTLQVYLGLRRDRDWWKSWRNAEYLNAEAARNVAIARRLHKRYGDHEAFHGYYIPHELWDGPFTDAQVAGLARFCQTIGRACHQVAPEKPVMVAPFVGRRPVPPEEFEQLWDRLLDRDGLDIVALQDGVGAQGIDADFEQRIVPYFQALQRVCRKHDVEPWCDLESFRLTNGDPDHPRFEPAPIERVLRQLNTVQPYVSGIVTFDFYHYMSPYRGEKQKMLYDGYLKLLETPAVEADDPRS